MRVRKYKGKGFFTQTLRSMNLYSEPSTSKLLSNLKSVNDSKYVNLNPILVGWVQDNKLIDNYANNFVKTYILFSEMTEVNPVLKTALFAIGNFKMYYDKHSKLKSVTIYISMHGGENIDESLTSPILNTVVSKIGRLGLCSWGPPISSMNFYKKLVTLNNQFEGPSVIENNLSYSKQIQNKLDKELKQRLAEEHNLPWSEIGREYKKAVRYNPSEYIRTYTHDKTFSVGLDQFTLTYGIYIIGVNNMDDKMYSALRKPNKIQYTYPNKEVVDILEKGTQQTESFPHYLTNQSYNLLNTDYLFNISEAITGQKFGFDKSIETEKYTNIPHYDKVYLSDILTYFKKLGVEHVNIIDDSCRFTKQPPPLLRQESFKEKQGWNEFTQKHPKMGGQKTRKK
jgi:hypothetical protein